MTYREAVRDAMVQAMRADADVFVMGEDIAEMGGSMGVTQGMLEEFGAERVRNTPISEMAIVGAGIGAAMQGMRPIVEIMYEDFTTLAMEQIVNQAAKHRYMSGGQLKVPLTIRTQGGAGWSPGAQHAQQLEAWFCPRARAEGRLPVDARRRARPALELDLRRQPACSSSSTACSTRSRARCRTSVEPLELGSARVHREGEDVTVVAIGRLVHEALRAAAEAEAEGISVEVLDPRTLLPLDEDALVALGQEDEPLRRRARGGRPDGLRRRDRGGRAGAGVRLPRRAGRARRCEVLPRSRSRR